MKLLKISSSKQEDIEKWRKISKLAEDEARKLAETLKDSREGKLHRKRPRTECMQNLVQEPEKQAGHPALLDALNGLLTTYSKNDQEQQTHRGRGKQPAHGKGYLKKGGPQQGH